MKTAGYRITSLLLNLGMPGLGHVYCREYLFGVFIFLVMLIAVVLFFVSFFLTLSFWPKAILLALPIVFYLFTFVDLYRVVGPKQGKVGRTRRGLWLFIIIALSYQILAPTAPGNFFIRNHPHPFVLEDNSLNPIFSRGDLLKASRLAYSVDILFLEQPIIHTMPCRFDPVRFTDQNGRLRNGIVIGLPREELLMVDGVLVVNGLPVVEEPPGGLVLQGDCELTYVDDYSILTATLNLGMLDMVYMVNLRDLVGKIEKVF